MEYRYGFAKGQSISDNLKVIQACYEELRSGLASETEIKSRLSFLVFNVLSPGSVFLRFIMSFTVLNQERLHGDICQAFNKKLQAHIPEIAWDWRLDCTHIGDKYDYGRLIMCRDFSLPTHLKVRRDLLILREGSFHKAGSIWEGLRKIDWQEAIGKKEFLIERVTEMGDFHRASLPETLEVDCADLKADLLAYLGLTDFKHLHFSH